MNACKILINTIDKITAVIGKTVAWLLYALMLLMSLVVVLRYGFNYGSIAMQEALTYLHASVFLLGLSYALQQQAHVRVDIFYRRFTPVQRAWVNSIGGLVLLLPLCLLLWVSSFSFVAQSWSINEGSPDPGGIQAVYLLKSLIPAAASLLALQAIAEILRSSLLLIESVTDD